MTSNPFILWPKQSRRTRCKINTTQFLPRNRSLRKDTYFTCSFKENFNTILWVDFEWQWKIKNQNQRTKFRVRVRNTAFSGLILLPEFINNWTAVHFGKCNKLKVWKFIENKRRIGANMLWLFYSFNYLFYFSHLFSFI